MSKAKVALILVQLLHCLQSQVVYEECSSIGCVHASAKLLSRLSGKNPCDDFYEFSCGTFLRNTYTPDEKVAVNTESLLNDQLDEHLFRIFSKPVEENEPRPHITAKRFYENCMNLDQIKMVGNSELVKLLDTLGGWPVLKGEWNETAWSPEKSLLMLHRFVGEGRRTNIFRNNNPDGLQDEDEDEDEMKHVQGIKRFKRDTTDGKDETLTLYKKYMLSSAISFGAASSDQVKEELEKALELGLALNALLDGKSFNRKSSIRKEEKIELDLEMNIVRWIELFNRFSMKTVQSKIIDTTKSVYDNLKNLKSIYSKRDFANYILWRFVEFSSQFLLDDGQENVFQLLKQSFGVLDKDQRWKLCTRMTNTYATLASGSLYIREYFSQESRAAAVKMVQSIIEEFNRTIDESKWMDQGVKQKAKKTVGELKYYIGYDDKLLSIAEVENYYGTPYRDVHQSFLYLGLQLNVHKADKTFNHKYRKQPDWTIYSNPTSTRATYTRKDNTMFFAAAFLQPPNFDKDRPASMNFGAIGSVIAHELTHCFDRFTQELEGWSAESTQSYIEKLKCIVDQYSKFEDPDLHVNLNGTVTVEEDTADNGGIKLAYRAYEKWVNESQKPQTRLIALEYTPEQLFWISYAQFYCTVQRQELKKRLLDSQEKHSFDRFRVMGPLKNSPEFAKAFNCQITDKMSPDKEICAIW